MKKIGFIGLGNMGSNMVKNLLKAGNTVNVFDLNEKAMDDLIQFGANKTKSLEELSQKSDVIFIMVMNFKQVTSVVMGENGVLNSMKKGSTLVVCSTISPSETKSISEKVEEKGVSYIDCPVSGGKDGAINATLVMMAACKKSVFDDVKDILFAMGSNTYHVSDIIGNGQVMKSINQIMISTGMAIAAEAVTMAVKSGLKPQDIYEVISKCTGRSDVFLDKLPLVMKRDFAPRGEVDIFIKDLSIALDIGKEVKSPMFISSIVKQIFTWSSACGYGREDLGALIKAYEDVAGVTVE